MSFKARIEHSSYASIETTKMAPHRDDSTRSTSENQYFADNAAPAAIDKHTSLAGTFIAHHQSQSRRVVLITSGGTTVPLENQTVRFLDNFSAGTRGATSAEYFLEAGYAVIFLHRQFSQLPYSRHYSHSTHCFLDFMREDAEEHVSVRGEHQDEMLHVLRQYMAAKENDMLLLLTFVTVTDYLWNLRAIARLMKPLGPSGLFYLAAAVSDFFIPGNRMAEHKIQAAEEYSNNGNTSSHAANGDSHGPMQAARMDGKRLVVDLEPVPKFLRNLTEGWAPGCMIVGFKLETDPPLLVSKAKDALAKYQHHLVIGNLLATRKWEVVLVTGDGTIEWIRVPEKKRNRSKSGIASLIGQAERAEKEKGSHPKMTVDEPERKAASKSLEIESLIVPEVARLHSEHIKRIET